MSDGSSKRPSAALSPEKQRLLLQQMRQRGGRAKPAVERPKIERRPRDGAPLPLSFAQQRLWILDQLEPGNPTYNVPTAIRLLGTPDLAALERSFQEIVRRHEVLRTTFRSEDGQALQVIAPEMALPLVRVDLRRLPESARSAEAQRRVDEEAQRPFDLARGPLMRACLLQLAEQEYVLVMTMHHIVSDGWSKGVLVREVAALYHAYAAAEASPLPELPLQYADYALWQRDYLRGEVLEAQLSWWRQQLGGAQALELPTDHPRPAIQTYRGARRAFTLPQGLSEKLKALSKAEHASDFMVLLAGFQALLYRYTGHDDLSVGSPIAGRHHEELEPLIGFFVNTLVLRTQVSPAMTFRELLGRVRETTLGAYAHQDVPFEKLVEELHPERDPSRTPLFQVMFALQNVPESELAFPGLRLQVLPLEGRTAKFDLSLALAHTAQGFEGTLEYNVDLFEEATAARMLEHLRLLLEGIAANPDARLSALPLLTEAERRRMLVEWNQTSSPSEETCVHAQFEAQAARAPDAVAVVAPDETLTYSKLNRRANQLAGYLRELGVGPEVLVAVCLERSADLLVGLLGVLKAGGAYVPLDPSYPRERLAFLLKDCGASVVLTTRALQESVSHGGAKVICLDADREAWAQRSSANLPGGAEPNHLAYVIYTSGSTGTPKGVAVQHRSLANLVAWHRREYGVTPADRATQVASLGFDAAVWEIWPYLTAGASLYLPDEERRASPPRLLQWLASEGITLCFLPTPLAEAVLDEPWPEPMALRALLTGGDRLVRRPPPGMKAALVNHYGPTEGTVVATRAPVRAEAGNPPPPPIGTPIGNTQVYLLDANLQPVPVGVAGELCIGGAGLARGYLRRPELTAERFIPDPFSPLPGARLYRTGDLARYLPDGQLEHLGRLDHQVKVRGFRIELGEIEATLARQPSVREAVVVVRKDAANRARLVAYVVGQGQAPDTAALRAALQATLPEYMVPSTFVALDALPLTPHGKVDRKALPAPASTAGDRERTYVAPRNPTEQKLAEIWARLLNVNPVGVEHNFFELGGDSILAIQLVARARQAGLHLSVRQLFRHQTIAELATVATAAAALEVPQGPVRGEVPLTPIQRWFFEQRLPEPHHFNQALMLSVHQPLDPAVLERALAKLVEHHDALRLRFTQSADGWRQEHVDDCAPSLIRLDLSALPAAERPAAVEAEATKLQRSFRLSEAPLVRAALIHLGEGQPDRLLLAVHHLVVDAVSWRVLLEDLQTVYVQLSQGRPAQLPPKTTSFKTWAEKLVAHARSAAVEAELPAWLAEPTPAPKPLPVDRPGGDNTAASTRAASAKLTPEETQALLQEAPAAYRAQINDLLLTALALALSRWTGGTSFRVDLEGHGREELFEDVDLSRTVGWFTSVAPVLLALPASASPGESLRSVRDALRQATAHGLGYGLLRYLGKPEARDALRALSPAQVGFNYLGQLDATLDGSSLLAPAPESSGPSHSPLGERPHLFEVNAFVSGGCLTVAWGYSEGLHREATAASLAEGFVAALRALLAHRHAPDALRYTPSDFPLARISREALDRLLPAGARTEGLYPLSPMQQGMLFHSLRSSASGFYVEQLSLTLDARVDLGVLRRAWEALLAHHPLLRTSFHWRDLDEPLQWVHPEVSLPWEELDWRALAPAERQSRLAALLSEQQARGFELERAPLMRLTVIRLDEQSYQLVWSHHHLLLDGWSRGILIQQLLGAYQALRADQPAAPRRSPPFRDYIAWLQRQDLGRAESWWRASLEGFTAPTPFPPPAPSSPAEPAQERRLLPLPPAALASLRNFAQAHQLTLNTLVQGAWALLLSRFSGEQDVVFGTTTAGRPPELPGIESMVGLFINTLPVRARIASGQPVVAWLQQLQSWLLEQRQYEYTPLVKVQGWSQVPRSAPLFETLCVFENYPVDPSTAAQDSTLVRDVQTLSRAHYPVTLVVGTGEGLNLSLRYDPSRLGFEIAERLLESLKSVLEGFAARPAQRLGEVSLLTPRERQQVLAAWNDTRRDFPRDACVHSLFEAQAARTPDAVAVEFEGRTLTYRALDRQANQLAHHLRSLGVRAGELVGLSLERSLEVVPAILGILKAGAAYLPLDAAYPAERLAFMQRQARARVLVTHSSLAKALPSEGLRVVCLDAEEERIAQQPESAPNAGASADGLAYVMFTSGSTGEPKGVCVPHRAVVRLVIGSDFTPLDARQVFLLLAPLSFDASTLELWGALLHGAKLVVAPPHAPTMEELGAMLDRHGVTTLWLTAALFEQLAAAQPEALGRVRRVLTGGDVVPPGAAKRHLTHGNVLVNGYGPTEGTTFTTTHALRSPEDVRGPLPIGRPIANARVYVVDDALAPVPVGAPGELYIGGDGLAWGYLNRPEWTAERFVPDPFSAEPGARLYRTGDIVRWMPDGTLDFVGRRDAQVKVRGFRIELGEIGARLAAHPAVREAVVVVREDVPGDKRLVAYVVAAQGNAPAAAELREHVARTLPAYMVPSAFVALAAFPLTPNGKVDRKTLPTPESRQDPDSYVAPRTPTEELLAGIWTQVLNVPKVGAQDGFFELGGHSLLATQVISRIRTAFQVELPLSALFEAPTLGALAARVEAAVQAGRGLALPPLRPQPRPEATPLSFAQQRLWFLAQLEPENPFYNVPTAIRLEGELDVPVLERCFTEVLRRHESLRTTFRATDSGPVQVIQPAPALSLHPVDLRALSTSKREQEARRRVDAEVRRPFNLSKDIPFRALLLQAADREHVLLVVMHHIASDGWSSSVLVREVAALYQAFSQGQPSPLPELRVQYADYALWQRSWLQGEALEQQLAYWRQQLEGAPQVLELPTDRPRPAVRSHQGAFVSSRIPRELSEKLKALGHQEGATLFMTLLTAFQALLSRYTGQQDVLVGTDIANRNHAGTEELIGFFINQLVMRADLSANPSFQQLLAQVRQTALAAYAHQDLPFEELVRELNPERSMSHAPLFQVKLVLQNMPFSALEIPKLTLRPFGADPGTTKLDLQLFAVDTEDGLALSWRYSSDLFDASTVSRMAEHFQRLLEGIVATPSKALAELPLLSDDERRQLLVDWNDTRTDFPVSCVHHLFESHAARNPDTIALVFENSHLTYGELNRKANQLAHHLRHLGVRAETRVGLFVERSLDAIVGMLGILKAGGAYVPLDPAFSQVSDRLAFMLQDSSASLVVTQESLADELPSSSGQFLVCLDSDWDQIAVQPDSNPTSEVSPENLVYIIYTSGSTGMPKGVSIEHRHLTRYLEGVSGRLELPEGASFASISTLAADLGNTAIFPSLCRGGTLHLISRERATDAEALGSLLSRHPVDCLKIVPSHLRALLASSNPKALLPRKRLVLGGEASDWTLIQQFKSFAPDCLVFNHYGPTETTVGVFTHRVPTEPGAAHDSATVPIGQPIPNTTAYILDTHLQPVPRGVPGELFIGGLSVGRGYLRRPDLTAERFLPDPFNATPGARLYRTGDRVRLLPNGTVEFLGRVDFQLKLRGFRIELGEIEASVKQHPAIDTAVVIAREDTPGNPRLVAYLVPHEGRSADAAELRAFLKTKLPDYMVPSSFVTLNALPLTPNGKLDRKALPAPDDLRQEADTFVAPRTPTEELLAGIWAQVLNLPRVGVRDDFFDLGGHSLLATQIISRIRSAFQVELPLGDLFEAPTLGALAARIEAAVQGGRGLAIPPLRPQARPENPPLSFAQQRLWFLAQLEPNNPFYNAPTALRMDGELDVSILERCFAEVLRRHESLRTTFRATESGPVQVIQAAPALPLQQLDLGALPESSREDEARRRVIEEVRRPFDLSKDIPFRAMLVHLAEQQYVLVVVMHHIVSDGWSSGVLVREVAALYEAFSQGQPSPLPELSIQYADYAVWQRSWLQGEALDRQLSYWRQQLESAPQVLDLPADRPRPAVRSHQGAFVASRIPRELSEKLKALGHQEGATLFMTLLSAFQALLSRYTGQQDILVGTDIANRNHAGTEELIGFFINQLVMRADLSADPSFQQLLAQVRQTALAAYAHQDLPFEELVREVNPERSMSHAPLFQVKLVLQNMPFSALEIPKLTLRPFGADPGTTKLDLQLFVGDSEDGLVLSWRYSTDLFEAPTISRMSEHFQRLLEGIVNAPDARLSDLPLLSDDERRQLLVDWNDTRADLPVACVHQLFESHAARNPDTIALVFEDSQLTYGELNRKANQLAHHLRRLGVRAETRVGLFVERSLDAIVGMLGILKAGGAYVPLDPAFSQVSDRLAFMLQDSSASLVVTQESLADELPSSSSQLLVCLDSDWDQIAVQPDSNPTSEVSPENLVYIIYTSGSTGMPKGVSIEHRQLSNYLQGVAQRLEIPEGASLASISTLAADLGNTALFPALCLGGTLHLLSREQATDVAALTSQLTRRPVDLLKIVPSHLRALLAAPNPEVLLPRKRLVLGGEASDWALIEQVHKLAPDCTVFNHYGPTETTVGVLTNRASRDTDPELRFATLPIGKPIPNATAYVLDSRMHPVPRGVPGELFIGGLAVGRGYLRRPDLTAERFLPDPFSSTPGGRLYRAGDRVRMLPNGAIEFLGRVDFQLKLRGFRIELGEIEASLKQHPAIDTAVVIAREDTPGNPRLVAYLVPHDAQDADAAELRSFLKTKLPDYMVPSAFVSLPVLPITPNGKLDRKALPPPDDLAQSTDAYVAPRDLLEVTLAGIFEDLLNIRPVSAQGNFFELGGHSLMAVQLVMRIRERTGQSIPVAALFESPTVEKLAALLRREGAGPWSPLVPLQRNGKQRPFFCVHPVGGTAFCYAELARNLGTDRPFYGLQAPGVDGEQPALDTVEALARVYVDAIRTVQPHGPYLLGGWSFGGKVAYEMAQQLRSQREEVALLALFDTHAQMDPLEGALGGELRDFNVHFFRTVEMTLGRSLGVSDDELRAMSDEEMLEFMLAAARKANLVLPNAGLEQVRGLRDVNRLNLRASAAYTLRPCEAPITLFAAQETRTGVPRDRHWGALARGGLEIHDVPGTHQQLMTKPFVDHIAAALAGCLERTDEKADDSQRKVG